MFFGGRLKTMPPKLLSEDGRHIVIRPLAYVAERDIERYARARAFPIIPCNLCGSQEHLQRAAVKKMLADWEREHPGRTEAIFSALRNVQASHLADPVGLRFRGARGARRRIAAMPPQSRSTPKCLSPAHEPWESALGARATLPAVAVTVEEIDRESEARPDQQPDPRVARQEERHAETHDARPRCR